MNRTYWFILSWIIGTVALMSSCQYTDSLPTYLPGLSKDVDSIHQIPARPYALNSNFVVISDTLWLRILPFRDSIAVIKGNELVVAEFSIHPKDSVDSVWVKVARDQQTIGWLREKDLLENIVPVDPISRAIHWFSNSHTQPFFMIVCGFLLWFFYRSYRRKQIKQVWFNDIDSVFPICLIWLLVTAAMLYNTMQHFVPQTWQRFYYDPSLSPLDVPGILSAFILCLWLIALVGIALLDDIFHLAKPELAFFYLVGLFTFCILSYILFTWIWVYMAYALWILYTLWAVIRLRKVGRHVYACGNCGQTMRKKGICPNCGALNE